MRFSFKEPEDHQPPSPSLVLDLKQSQSQSNSTPKAELQLFPQSTSTPKSELQWFPLQNHPLFSSTTISSAIPRERMPPNLMAWDGASRLYFWDLRMKCLHRISIRLGEPDPSSIIAAYPSKVLKAEIPLNFVVNKISINGNGSALLLVGSEGLRVMYLYGRSSPEENAIICRSVLVGSEIYFNTNNFIRILQISWHPYSDTHLGILSSDSVFRIFDLSTNIGQSEQEYYLQPVEPGSSRNAAAICHVDFAFGGNHLWDKFSVFILFSDGSTYIICPVVPFGSVYLWESISEIYADAHTFGLKSTNPIAVSNSNLAISWLEETFPELVHQPGDDGKLHAVKAHPYVFLDASVSLQGPLRKVSNGVSQDSEIRSRLCEGRAIGLLYNLIGKDSVLVIAWSGGQLQLDALADEIQPVWKSGSAPRLCVDSSNQILGAAMICESNSSTTKINHTHTVWLGHPPPLLRLAVVDLALPDNDNNSSSSNKSPISMMFDPLVPERIFCVHSGGIDSIVLHFLPFTNQNSENEKQEIRTPSVLSVVSTCSPLYGFIAVADSFGSCWILGVTSEDECVVVEVGTWNVSLTDVMNRIVEKGVSDNDEVVEAIDTDMMPTVISKDLLGGPKEVMLAPSDPSKRSISSDSIEGRSILHQCFRTFHEKYVEYAHKVYFELEHHGPHLKKIIENQNCRLRKAQEMVMEVERKQERIDERMERALRNHSSIEERLLKLRRLPGVHKRPLSKAEREFKSEIDKFTGLELDALHSTIEALRCRLQRHVSSDTQRLGKSVKNAKVQDDVSQLKSALAKLSLVNTDNSRKVKLLESALRNKESCE